MPEHHQTVAATGIHPSNPTPLSAFRCVAPNPLHTPRPHAVDGEYSAGTSAIDWLTCLVHLRSLALIIYLSTLSAAYRVPQTVFPPFCPARPSSHPLYASYHSNCGIKPFAPFAVHASFHLLSHAGTPRQAESRMFYVYPCNLTIPVCLQKILDDHPFSVFLMAAFTLDFFLTVIYSLSRNYSNRFFLISQT